MEEGSEPQNSNLSFCDILKNNTTSIVKKAESQIPSYAQLYSDLYSQYLHSMNDLFGTCYLSEKEFFDKLGVNQEQLKILDNFLSSISGMVSSNIELSTQFLRAYIQTQISTIKSYDGVTHLLMDSYARYLSQISNPPRY